MNRVRIAWHNIAKQMRCIRLGKPLAREVRDLRAGSIPGSRPTVRSTSSKLVRTKASKEESARQRGQRRTQVCRHFQTLRAAFAVRGCPGVCHVPRSTCLVPAKNLNLAIADNTICRAFLEALWESQTERREWPDASCAGGPCERHGAKPRRPPTRTAEGSPITETLRA
jgi:hypothetical protein